MRILIVEDDRATARLLSGLITSWGYDVVLADDGKGALAAMGEQLAPQLVLLGWVLPDIDGLELCHRIRAHGGDAPAHIILLTSKNARADLIAGLEAGADEYLVKPIDLDELRVRLVAGARLILLQQRLADRVLELERAMENVRTLSGLLPICAYCHSIRDDSNYWHRVEEYVSERSAATFSHGICPKCLPRVEREMDAELSAE